MQPLKFNDAMMLRDGSILECPACGGENLHQERVDSWFRVQHKGLTLVGWL